MEKLKPISTESNGCEVAGVVVIHPLDDLPEHKRNGDGLGLMKMSKSMKCTLFVLRVYLFTVVGLAIYRILALALLHR